MILLKTTIEFALVILLIYGFMHEAEIARFERLIFTKRGRTILKKNIKECLKWFCGLSLYSFYWFLLTQYCPIKN